MKSKHWRHSSNIECRVQKEITKVNYSRNFERKERKFQKYLRYIVRKRKKNIEMVTQRQINSLKRLFNAAIKEVSDLLNENREIKEENVAVFIVCKENIKKQL